MDPERTLITAFFEGHPGDAARVIERLPSSDLAVLLAEAPPGSAAEVLRRMASPQAAYCLAAMDSDRVSAILPEVPIHTAAAMLRQATPEVQEVVLAKLSQDSAERLRVLLRYPEDTAGSLMDPLTLALPDDITVGEAMGRMRRFPLHVSFYVYVLDRERKLAGVLDIRELMIAHSNELLTAVMKGRPAKIRADAGIADITSHAGWRDYDALPVVDGDGVFLGALRHRTLRRIEQDTPAREDGATETLAALAELYFIGAGGILRGLTSPGDSDAR
jgi:magnesium transporter